MKIYRQDLQCLSDKSIILLFIVCVFFFFFWMRAQFVNTFKTFVVKS